jgi:choice-of-anchor B domain-containing protein
MTSSFHFKPLASFATICLLVLCSVSNPLQAQTANIEMLYNYQNPALPGSFAFANVYNETWGFVQGGREYGVIGTTWGTHFFDLSDPENIYQVDSVEAAFTGGGVIHRDYHDYGGYLYAVCDEGSGTSTVQIIDLQYLPDSVSVVYDDLDLFSTAHNIFIDTAEAIMYSFLTGFAPGFTSVAAWDISTPTAPVLLREFDEGTQVHDGYVDQGLAFLNDGYNGRFLIMDWTDPVSPVVLGSLDTYPDQGYNHSGWLHDNRDIYVFADENHGYDLKVCDVTDPSDIQVLSTFNSGVDSMSIAHNLIFRGDYIYTSYYHDGLYIHDLSDPANPQYVASYKTYQPDDHESYRGAWGVYPLLPSGLVLVSDMQFGFFVFRVDGLGLNADEIEIDQIQFSNAYPNPAYDMLQIDIQNHIPQNIEISLVDLQGRILKQQQQHLGTGSKSVSVHLGDLSEGLYVLKIQTPGGNSAEQFVRIGGR